MSEQRPRRKRHQRDTQPPAMVLTERDKQIVEAVYLYRCLRQDQIHALFFGGAKAASQRRLARLYHHGFIARRFLSVRASTQFSAIAYVLDKAGIELLRTEMGYDELDWQPFHNELGVSFLAHALAISDVRVLITLACRELGYSVLTWRGESEMKADYDRVILPTPSGKKKSVSLIPDSYFLLDTPLGKAHFFLELDRGTMGTERFKTKIHAYQEYFRSGAFEQRYGGRNFRVLTVTLSQVRLMSLKSTTETRRGGHQFWFGVLSTFTPENILSSSVWSVAGQQEPGILIQIE